MCHNRGWRCVDYGSLSLSGTACQLIFCVFSGNFTIHHTHTHTHTHTRPCSVQHVQRSVLQIHLANPCVLHGGIGWSLGCCSAVSPWHVLAQQYQFNWSQSYSLFVNKILLCNTVTAKLFTSDPSQHSVHSPFNVSNLQ